MTYEEINPGEWKYDKDGDFIEGFLVSKKSNVGPNNANLYGLQTVEGIKNVWGSTILDSRMDFVEIGVKMKITYKGVGEAKSGHNPPKIFKVEVDKE